MPVFTVLIDECSIDAANNVRKILFESSLKYASECKKSVAANIDCTKTKDGAQVRFSSVDGNFMFAAALELGLQMHTVCSHNVKHAVYDYSRN